MMNINAGTITTPPPIPNSPERTPAPNPINRNISNKIVLLFVAWHSDHSNISVQQAIREQKMDRPKLFLGLRTVIYSAPDLTRAKEWYSNAFGIEPHFDEPFYVGFNIGGYELGLDPNAKNVGAGGVVPYFGVGNIDEAMTHMKSIGGEISEAAHEVGEGIKVGSVLDPFGNVLGIIENPHFDPTSTR
jgi:predicted enzyme related to lactoylglutathione lyase